MLASSASSAANSTRLIQTKCVKMTFGPQPYGDVHFSHSLLKRVQREFCVKQHIHGRVKGSAQPLLHLEKKLCVVPARLFHKALGQRVHGGS